MNRILISISVAALLLSGCGDKPNEQRDETNSSVSQSSDISPQNIYGASAQQVPAAQAPNETDMKLNTPHVANVLETMNGGGYTYAKVNENGTVYWIAGPQSNISVGTSISFVEQMVMQDFTSKALNRTFDNLVFVSAIVSSDKAASADISDDAHKNCNHDKELKMEPAPLKIAKNKGGYSVEELYAKKDALKDKSVKVNANVVKVSKNIMGKDWVHLQDGTGSAGTNDIIATSVNSNVAVGDTVTASGVVKTDINLGYGYQFALIIEEAKFSPIK